MKKLVRQLLLLRNQLDDLAKSICKHTWSKFNYSGSTTYTCRYCGKVDWTKGGQITEPEYQKQEWGNNVF
jgi:hypothetical protein